MIILLLLLIIIIIIIIIISLCSGGTWAWGNIPGSRMGEHPDGRNTSNADDDMSGMQPRVTMGSQNPAT